MEGYVAALQLEYAVILASAKKAMPAPWESVDLVTCDADNFGMPCTLDVNVGTCIGRSLRGR